MVIMYTRYAEIMVTLVLFRPFIVIDVHLLIPDWSCCSLDILVNMRGVENIATPSSLYTLFHGTDDIAVVSLLRFQIRCLILCILFCFWVIPVSIGFYQACYVNNKLFIALYVFPSVWLVLESSGPLPF